MQQNPRVALATCSSLPRLSADDAQLPGLLREMGVDVEVVRWDAPVDWTGFTHVVVRSTWDYVQRWREYHDWVCGFQVPDMPQLLNDPRLVLWNLDKRYLTELSQLGIPAVPTVFVEPGSALPDSPIFPECDRIVVKPAVSASAADTGIFERDDTAWQQECYRMTQSGRACMIQPFISAIETDGEIGLVFIAGSFSHAFRKPQLLTSADGRRDTGPEPPVRSTHVSSQLIDFGASVLRATARASGVDIPLYARVDTVPYAGSRAVLEVELIEPGLYLATAQGAAERFARAIRDVVRG